MKLSYQWLKKIVNFDLSPQQLAERLTNQVAEAEVIKQSGQHLDKIVVAKILAIRPHPQADRLQLVTALTKLPKESQKTQLEIVCGAPNIKVGQMVPLALIGACLPNGVEIKEAVIRGVTSTGMLCAEDELGLGPDHAGILILDEQAKIGEPISNVLGLSDTILEIENKSITHRPDLFSHWGFAREIFALLGKQFLPDLPKVNLADKKLANKSLNIKVENNQLCPAYFAIRLTNIQVKPSPRWLQQRLNAIGIKSINQIVDITNYVMAEIGQPLHAFDADKLTDGKIIIRLAKQGEKIIALDQQTYRLSANNLVIADNKKAIALAGIIGGDSSKIDANTKNIILESANFDPVNIRRTSRQFNLRTESAIRFEKGLPVNFPLFGLQRAVQLFQKISDSKIDSCLFSQTNKLFEQRLIRRKKILIFPDKINEFLGVALTPNKITSVLETIGCQIKQTDLRKEIIKLAKQQLNKPFRYGVSTFLDAPKIFDCSSLTKYLYRQIGVELPRNSIMQINEGESIDLVNALSGDLVFAKGNKPYFDKTFPEGIGHVGIYLGKNKVIHASSSAKKIIKTTIANFSSKKDWRGVRRFISQKRGWVITAPIWRPDLQLMPDLAEEIMRLVGYQSIKPQPLSIVSQAVKANNLLFWQSKIKNWLANLEFTEVYNYSFYGETESQPVINQHIQLANPLNPDQKYLRISLLPNLLKLIKKNKLHFSQFKVFEVGHIYLNQYLASQQINEPTMVSGIIVQSAKTEEIFYCVKGIINYLAEKLKIDESRINFLPIPNKCELCRKIFDVKESASIKIDQQIIGTLGKIKQGCGGFEINLTKLIALMKDQAIIFKTPSIYPPVERDLGFVVEKGTAYANLVSAIKQVSPMIKQIDLFDLYQAPKLGKTKKYLAFHLIIQSDDHTLIQQEISQLQDKIVQQLEKQFSAQLRNF